MDAYIKGELLMMADSLVAPTNRDFCRSNASIDFTMLENSWVPHKEFNNYMAALRQKVGQIGPRLVGKQIAKTLDGMTGALTKAEYVVKAFTIITEMYKENNKGADVDEYKIETLQNGFIRVVTRSPLDEGFHIGVGEGFIRFYNKLLTRADLVENMAIHGRTVFEYEWKA